MRSRRPRAPDPPRDRRAAQQALATGSGTSEQVSKQSTAFTGTISGSSVTLSLNQGLGQ
ncbi:MAG: hypothetical protein ACXVHJ_14625 [Solirubrobacteraceae bacterium]